MKMPRKLPLTILALICAGSAAGAPARPPITSVSHLAVYAADMSRSEAFYVHDLGAVKRPDPENPQGVRYYFNPQQYVEVLPLPAGPAAINRLDHAAFNTADAEALRVYLADKGYTVPAQIEKGADGGQWFTVTDPEGMRIQFVQPPRRRLAVAVNPLSSHIIHLGFIIHDRARQDRFYRDLLGFRPYWFGGNRDAAPPTWISQQVPDGTDWLEYMVVGTPDGQGIPPTMSQANLGVLDHFSLGIANMETAFNLLWDGDRLRGQAGTPRIGRDAKWQLTLLDPDGTRAEVMEFHAVGTPCCSPFTAKDPDR